MPVPKKVVAKKDARGEIRIGMVFKNGKKLNVSQGYDNSTYARKMGQELAHALGVKFEDQVKKKR